MAKLPKNGKTSQKISYSMKPSKSGRAIFSDVRLPDGTIIRRVDESVHRRALSNAARAFKEKA